MQNDENKPITASDRYQMTIADHRAGLRDMGFLLIEDGHWEPGTWMHAVAQATALKGLPFSFVMLVGEPLEAAFRETENKFIGICNNPPNVMALMKALGDTFTRFNAPIKNSRGKLVQPWNPRKSMREAVARVYPAVSPVDSSAFSIKVNWWVSDAPKVLEDWTKR